MKYAVVDGKLTHVNKVPKGTIAREFGYSNYPNERHVKAFL